MIFNLTQAKEWYEAREGRISSFFLLFGFVFDSLTLQRIDALRENLWIALNLLVVAFCIVLLNREGKPVEVGTPAYESGTSPKHFWLTNIIQFGFGALLGAFFIFYFRSSTLSGAWPFLLILLAAMVANELFQKRYARLVFQISFFYLSLFSFAIFLLPLLLHRIGVGVFLLSGLTSLSALWLFILILKRFAREKFRESKLLLKRSVAIIFISINILYFTNLIPPIPLSLKDAGIYHSVIRSDDGNYVVTEEDRGWTRYFHLREIIHLPSGGELYFYSAIFSPVDFNTNIVHEWQYKDEKTGKWVTVTRTPLPLSGGRAGGFRTYSVKSNLIPGSWRVNVVTLRGQLIGRLGFSIIPVASLPPLVTSVKD